MTNLRSMIEDDLAVTLEGDFGMPVILTGPDGTVQSAVGQVLGDTILVNPESGDQMVVDNPVVTLRRTNLDPVPRSGETWHVKIPVGPEDGAELVDFVIDADRPPEGGKSIGFIRLYLRKVKQQSP